VLLLLAACLAGLPADDANERDDAEHEPGQHEQCHEQHQEVRRLNGSHSPIVARHSCARQKSRR